MNKKVVVQILRAPIGGIRKHVYDILLSLPEDDFEHIFISNMAEADYALPERKNLKVFHLDIEERPSFRDLLNLFRIYGMLAKLGPEVLHGHGAKGGLYARIVAYFLRAKCVYTPHGGSLHRVHGKLKNALYDAVEIFLIPFTHVFLFESRYSKETFCKNVMELGPKALVNHNGTDLAGSLEAPPYEKGRKLRMASFGLLRQLKGHDIAIEACRLLKGKGIPFSLDIYGKGEELDALNGLIARYSLRDEVTIRDFTNDVQGEMLKHDLILQPSRFESFGYVPVEAMALKVPVVSSYEGGLKEVMDPEVGFIAYGNTPQEYFRILSDIHAGKAQVAQKVERARAKVLKEFGREKMLGTIAAIYAGR